MRIAVLARALFALALLHCTFAVAADWSKQDKVLFSASSALLVADWAQTRHIAKNPQLFYEKNPILGEHPSLGRVNTYFATVLVANYFITDALSPKWRTAYQAGLIGVELVVIGNNKRLGIKMDF
jgi:hypothetical protein